jgi:hypothetical protein
MGHPAFSRALSNTLVRGAGLDIQPYIDSASARALVVVY